MVNDGSVEYEISTEENSEGDGNSSAHNVTSTAVPEITDTVSTLNLGSFANIKY